MNINIKKEVEVQAKTLRLYMKVRDQFEATLLDQDGEAIKEYEGYVPGFMPEEHYGDYLILNIDIDTGTVTNWEVPSQEEIEEFINNDQD